MVTLASRQVLVVPGGWYHYFLLVFFLSWAVIRDSQSQMCTGKGKRKKDMWLPRQQPVADTLLYM